MKKLSLLLLGCLLSSVVFAQSNTDKIGKITIQPVHHASMVLSVPGKTIFTDPVDYVAELNQAGAPDIILITDIHGDHCSPETLDKLQLQNAVLVVPQAVADKLPAKYKSKEIILHNGDQKTVKDISIEAIPMYNLPESPDAYHTKGRGNGYVLVLDGKRVYISGDTEDIPEMRKLKNIDIAFVCMNLPYTMDIHQAANAVLAFKPKVIYPYHYGKSDVAAFKKLVESKDSAIDVRLRNWYPKE